MNIARRLWANRVKYEKKKEEENMVENQGCGSRKEEIRRKENKFQSAYARRIFNLLSHHMSKPKFCFKIKFFFSKRSIKIGRDKGGKKETKKTCKYFTFFGKDGL